MNRFITRIVFVALILQANALYAADLSNFLSQQFAAQDAALIQEIVAARQFESGADALGKSTAAVLTAISGGSAAKVVGFTTATLNLANNVNLLSLPPAALESMGIAPCLPYLGLAAGMFTLIGLAADNGSDAILQAIHGIAEQLCRFHDNIMIRFNRFDARFDAGLEQIMLEFLDLHKDQKDIRQKVKALHEKIHHNHDELLDTMQDLRRGSIAEHQEVMSQFATIHLDKINEAVSDVMGTFKRGEINSTNLARYIHELQKCICITAKNRALTGAAPSIEPGSALKDMKKWSDHPVFYNINALREYYAERFGENFGLDIVNPFVFRRCAQTLITLISQVKPEFATEQEKKACIADIDMIIQEAQHMVALLRKMEHPTKMGLLIDECVRAVQELQRVVEEQVKTGLTKKVKDLCTKHVEQAIDLDAKTLLGLPIVPFDSLQTQFHQTVEVIGKKSATLPVLHLLFFLDWENTGDWKRQREAILWRNKPILEDKDMWKWLRDLEIGCLTGGVRDTNSCMWARAVRAKLAVVAQERIAAHNLCIEALQSEVKKNRHSSQPSSTLIYPSQPHNKQVLVCTELWVDEAYVQAEKLGLGKIISYYHVTPDAHFVIESYFEKSLIEIRTMMNYDLPGSSDEDVINFWYGGRYAKASDTIKLARRLTSKMPDPLERVSLLPPPTPYQSARIQFAGAPMMRFNKDLEAVKAKIAEKLQQERCIINRDSLMKDLQVSSSPVAKIARELNRSYTILESACALIYNQEFASSPLAKHILATSEELTIDQQSIVTSMQHYQGTEIYPSLKSTLERFALVKRDELARSRPAQFLIVLQALVKLREARLIVHDARVVPVVSETETLRQEVKGLQDQMRAQTEQIAQLLALLRAR